MRRLQTMTRHNAGTDLLHDFGGEGPLAHIAHANGFPPGTYRALAETLLPDYHVIGLPSRPLWPGSKPSSAPGWHTLALDLEAGLEELGATSVLGIGHSLGGVLTLWASIRSPHLFRAIIVIEPVILLPRWLRMQRVLRLLNSVGLGPRPSLVHRALHRRHEWPSRRACFDYLRSKSLFQMCSDAVLWDYVQYGTRLNKDDSVQLVYPPSWEAHIFATPPMEVWRDLGQVPVPCIFIRGEQSTIFVPEVVDRVRRLLPQASLTTVPGAGHLLPMERPEEVGAIIRNFMEALCRA